MFYHHVLVISSHLQAMLSSNKGKNRFKQVGRGCLQGRRDKVDRPLINNRKFSGRVAETMSASRGKNWLTGFKQLNDHKVILQK
jgi:hypothetical protein